MDYFNRRIREYRMMKGYSQDDVAKRLNVSRTVYTQIENGNRKVSAEEVIALAKLYGVTTDCLLISDQRGVPKDLDDINVFEDVVYGYFEVNITKNVLIGDIVTINENGVHAAVSPVEKRNGRLDYDAFEYWWKNNMLAEDAHTFSNRYSRDKLVSAYGRGQKVVECKLLSRGRSSQYRSVKYTFYMSQLKTGDIYGVVVFFDISNMSFTVEDSRLLSELSVALSESFESLYYVDIRDDSYVVINNHGFFSRLNIRFTGRNFFAESIQNLRAIAYDDDFGKISPFLTKENLLGEFAGGSNSVISAHFRLMVENRPVYYRVRASVRKSDSDHILVAVENVNDAITKDLLYQAQLKRDRDIIEVLSAEYSSVYCVNLASNTFEICKIAEDIRSSMNLEELGKLSYTEIYRICVEKMIYEQDRPKMAEAGSIYNILVKLKDRSSFSVVYRSFVNGMLQYCEMKVVKIGTDTFPAEVVIGFADRSTEKNNEIVRELNVQKILNLSNNLEAVAEVDLSDGRYNFRTVIGFADNLTAAPYVHEGVLGENKIEDYLLFDVYEDDRQMLMSLLTIDGLIKKLKERPSFEVKYRSLNSGSFIWRSMKGVLNTHNNGSTVIIGIFNIDQEYRLEQEHAAEVKKLSYDAYFDKLTGTRNKNAYLVKEKEIDQQLLAGNTDDFAVAVFDINCLKNTNDNMGHDKGDDLIKTVASMICNTFGHSPVFRIGGDEFAVFLSGDDFVNRKMLMENICLQAKDRGDGVPVFAVGMADRCGSDRSVSDIFMRADEAMYADKVFSKESR